MAYSITQKKDIISRHAKVGDVELYRQLLRPYRASAANRVVLDEQELAESLLYNLLDFFTEEQLIALLPANRQMCEPIGEVQTVPARRKLSKFEAYPDIPWKNLDNPLIRTADNIFTDRVNNWSRLAELERDTDGAAKLPVEILEEIVLTSIRMEICFDELRHFNKSGEFLGKHPFIAQADERSRVSELIRQDPDRYFDERKNIELNISRYSSQINSKKTSKEQKDRARENLEKYQAKLSMYKEIFRNCIKS